MAFLYSNQGLLLSKYIKSDTHVEDTQELESVHGAFMAMIENLLEKISSEYNIDHYGSGSFETSEHRIIYFEAGSVAILLLVCSFIQYLYRISKSTLKLQAFYYACINEGRI